MTDAQIVSTDVWSRLVLAARPNEILSVRAFAAGWILLEPARVVTDTQAQ